MADCSEICGEDCISLFEHLQSCNYLSPELVLDLMLELAAGLSLLHSQNIVYLNWSSKNILVHQDPYGKVCVKFINFEASVIAGTILDLQSFLPIHLLSPEVLENKIVELSCDLWGVGCLLYELTTGHSVWYQYRHTSKSELLSAMKNERHPEPPDRYYSLKPLYQECWKMNPIERVDVVGLQELLSKNR
ncbi:hypothetical protein RRG08_005094 [Elysia crispata]|uniref:non-specific serine/threonine protein kinase n=1 Tax=Elysia crispata TaxID=231223 RepID=A0AAE1CPH2_9GAST|nr:hypothetical protein RRG08_005094 [Elysia crispata]